MGIKKINGTSLIKVSVLILTGFTLATMILNTIALYQTHKGNGNSAITLFAILIGIVLGVIVRAVLTLLFWSSYNIKYPNEKFNEKIGKKIIAYFLFMTALMGLSLSRGTLLIFIICTLLMALKEQKKLDVE